MGAHTQIDSVNGTLTLRDFTATDLDASDFTFFNPLAAEAPSEKQSAAAVSENLGVIIDTPIELADVSEAPGAKASVSEDLSIVSDVSDEPFGDQDLIANFLAQGGGEKAPLTYTDANSILAILAQDDTNTDFAEFFEV